MRREKVLNDEPNARIPLARMRACSARRTDKAVREREDMRKTPNGGLNRTKLSLGSRVLAELIGGSAVELSSAGSLTSFRNAPWGLLVVMALGVVAAFRNIIRISTSSGE
jgi:ATP synthase protein I